MVKKRGLGRGLDALLGTPDARSSARPDEELLEIPVDQLQPGKHQPRKSFDPEALASLADSIKSQGVVQPIVVRPAGANSYEIVAGERRWRAAKQVGLKTISAVVRKLPDRAAMAMALVENIQRADLNPLEEAQALQKLIKEVGLTHEQCAEAVGRSRAAVTNLLRLFELRDDVQSMLRENKLSLGHAKVLLGVSGPRQSALAAQVVERQYSVRQTEDLVHAAGAQKGKSGSRPRAKPSPVEGALSKKLGLEVKLRQGAQGAGVLSIRFREKAELDKLVRLLR